MPTNLTSAEKETIARFSEDPEDVLSVETFNKRHALRLIREGATVKHTTIRGNATYWTLSMPKAWFKWPRKPRVLSAERVQALRERIKATGIPRAKAKAVVG